jgi:hypothetical protein
MMEKKLDELLCKKYPKLFRDRNAPMTQTCMCWGFSHGDGWFNIISNLCANIQAHIDGEAKQRKQALAYNKMLAQAKTGNWKLFDTYYKAWKPNDPFVLARRADVQTDTPREVPEKPHQVVVTQVKEKFGTLRFYYNGGDDYIRGLVSMAEAMSATTCEECGSAGILRPGGWVHTACDAHAERK